MGSVEVLVATMSQADSSLYERMNWDGAAVIANQAKKNEITCCTMHNKSVKMITTKTRGVGLNRNIALLAATADILLFADDDVTYYDNCSENVVKAFEANSNADVIIFDMEFTKNGVVYDRFNNKCRKLNVFNVLKYGTYVIGVRRKAILQKNIMFSQLFGGGCIYSSGEDSLFLIECIRKGLKIYSSDYVLGKCAKDESSWFEGFTKKYFYDKGAWIACAFPRLKWILKMYFAFRLSKETEVPFYERLKLMRQGIKSIIELKPFT